jgi:hypothetical protein
MLPSFLVCVLATGLIAWVTWLLMRPGYFKLTFLGLAGLLWLGQGIRWGYRYFGYTYRMTTRRLFRDRGFLLGLRDQVELASVAGVVVRRRWFERLVGIGEVLVRPEDPARPPLTLEGVRQPARVAEEIRLAVQRAREAAACGAPGCPGGS